MSVKAIHINHNRVLGRLLTTNYVPPPTSQEDQLVHVRQLDHDWQDVHDRQPLAVRREARAVRRVARVVRRVANFEACWRNVAEAPIERSDLLYPVLT